MITPFILLAGLCLCAIHGLIIPITKTDGSLDISSLLSHISLLEQSLENKASVADISKLTQSVEGRASAAELTKLESDLTSTKSKLEGELKTAQTKITVLETRLDQCSCSLPGAQNSASPSEVKTLQYEVGNLIQDVFKLQSLHNRTSGTPSTGGSTFTRWGRTSCSADTSVFYKGYTGGTWSVENGGSGSIVCLPEHPIYANHTSGHNFLTSHIYGTEFDSDYPGNPLQQLYQEDIPCVVCESSRNKMVMIPGRNACYPGWTMEYWGYLLGGHPTHAAAEYICIDSNPEAIPGGQANTNGRTLFMVESRCGALPCPPYEDTWEVSCVVCSK